MSYTQLTEVPAHAIRRPNYCGTNAEAEAPGMRCIPNRSVQVCETQ